MRTATRHRTAAVSSALALGLGLVATLTGAGVQPNHNITCTYTPDVPYQYSAGGPVYGEAEIRCSPDAPDVSVTTFRIWRYDLARQKYYLMLEKTSSYRGTSWSIGGKVNCTARVKYLVHTQVLNSSFHGKWGDVDKNSRSVALYC